MWTENMASMSDVASMPRYLFQYLHFKAGRKNLCKVTWTTAVQKTIFLKQEG